MRVPNNFFIMPATTYNELVEEFGGGPLMVHCEVQQNTIHKLIAHHHRLPGLAVQVPWDCVNSETIDGTIWYGIRFVLHEDRLTGVCQVETIYRIFNDRDEAVMFKMKLAS